ncbi:MAG: ABC transporter ATP-binding protein [Phycisphaerales bacterium]|nr:ABC transporter ATP-binding protein [Phycisphaerales bacterium]
MIRIEAVRKRFGRFVALDGVDLDIARGEAVALWGPNGAGKTTLLRCTLGLINFKGRITIDGLDIRRRGKAARRRLGYIPQESILPPDLRVSEAMALFAGLRRATRKDVDRLLALVELNGARSRRVADCSGGMRQRLSLALALLGEPPLLVLDEPTSNLDAAGRKAFLDLLLELKRAGKTILFTSHRPDEVRVAADRIVTLENGRVVGIERVAPEADRRSPPPAPALNPTRASDATRPRPDQPFHDAPSSLGSGALA